MPGKPAARTMHLSEFRGDWEDPTPGAEGEEDSTSTEEDMFLFEDGQAPKLAMPSYPLLHDVAQPVRPPPAADADEHKKKEYEEYLLSRKQYGKYGQAEPIPAAYADEQEWLFQMMCHQATEFKHRVGSTLHDLHQGVYKTEPGEEHAWVQVKVTGAHDFSIVVELHEGDERIINRLRKDNTDLDNPVPEKRHTRSNWWEGYLLQVEGHSEVVYADEGDIGLRDINDAREVFKGTLRLSFPSGRPQKLKQGLILCIRPVDFIRPAINHYKSAVSLYEGVAHTTVYEPVRDLLRQVANPKLGPGEISRKDGLKPSTLSLCAPPDSFYGIIANLPGGLAAIQGPPGTGKSTAVKTIIAERVPVGTKALVVCVKNKAVDAVVGKLKDVPGGVVVFGSKRSLGPEAVKHRYDLKAERHPDWVRWVSILRQIQELRASLKKGCEDAQDSHYRSGPKSCSTSASAAAPKNASKANKLTDLEICQELCTTGTAPVDSLSDEEDDFMAGSPDSDDEAELADIAAAQEAEHSVENLADQDHTMGPFKLCMDDDPATSVSDIKGEIMAQAPSIPCARHEWIHDWKSPVEVLLNLRDALLLLFGKLAEPNSRGKREAEGILQRTMAELRDLAASPQKLNTAAEVQQFELDHLDRFMAWMTDEAVGKIMLLKVGGFVARDVLASASTVMSTIDTVPTLFEAMCKWRSRVGGSIQTVIVDEAGCVPEYELPNLLAFSPVRNLILIGDHRQLPSFSRINESRQARLHIMNHGRSLLERIIECDVDVPMLAVQYRMAKQISDVVSGMFYGGKLKTAPTVPQSRLQVQPPLRWVEVPMVSADKPRKDPKDPDARQRFESNPYEAEQAIKLALEAHDQLLCQGISHPSVYVIAPYNRQVDLLEEFLKERRSKRASLLERELARYPIDSGDLQSRERVEQLLMRKNMNRDLVGWLLTRKFQIELKGIMVLTVDKAQGSEADVVIVSTVKCGNFTQDPRRMCVALSRPRQQSILVGNSQEMQQHPMWARIIAAYKGAQACAVLW